MPNDDILIALLRTTLLLTLCGGIAWLALRKIEHQLPKLARLLWVAVLLTGWCWLQPVIQVPYYIAPTQEADASKTQSESLSPVIPAQIGTQQAGMEVARLDSGFHRNDALLLSDENVSPEPLAGASGFVTGSVEDYVISTGDATDAAYRILLSLWFAGMVITLLLAATGYIRVLCRLRCTEPAEDALAEPWEKLLTTHGIDPRKIPMVLSHDNAGQGLGPALIRTPWGYRLVVPYELWDELSESGRLGVLKHELAHFRRRDVWKSFFVRILALPHWFNPAAHYAANRFDELAEQLCDREAFAGQKAKPSQRGIAEFASVLLLLHENAPTHFVARQSILGRNLTKSRIGRRVASLLEIPPLERNFTMRKTLLVLGTAAILSVALFRVEFVARELPKEPGTEPPAVQSPDVNAEQHWSSVIDAETQQPLAGVQATLYFAKPGGVEVDRRTTISDAEGRIIFPLPSELDADMEAGTWILVEKEGYVSESNGRQAQWAERFLNEGRLVCDVFPLQRAETITGRLVDEQGQPLADVLISVLRQKARPFRNDYIEVETMDRTSDADGRFRIDVAKDEKIAFWALPETLAPQFVSPAQNQARGDHGNIVLKKGFEPIVTVLDKDGKPVHDVWVNLTRQGEDFAVGFLSPYTRSALTDQEGKARLHPVTEGDYNIRVRPSSMARRNPPWSIANSVTWRADRDGDAKTVDGVFYAINETLSETALEVTLQAQQTVNIDVQFSDKTADSYRELNANISGRQEDGNFFASRMSSDSPSAYQGDGLFSFQVPVGLENAAFRVPFDTNTTYRMRIEGESEWRNANNRSELPLGTIEQAMRIEVAAFKSPNIILNVVDELGQPVKEYYAWLEYISNGTPATIKVEGDKIRVEITSEHFHVIDWDYATSLVPLLGILNVSFKYKNFGNDETKINADGILPDEAMRLHIVGRGYEIVSQEVPKMSEGEERELTVVLPSPPLAQGPPREPGTPLTNVAESFDVTDSINISGRIRLPDGSPAAGYRVYVRTESRVGSPGDARGAIVHTAADGTFQIEDIPNLAESVLSIMSTNAGERFTMKPLEFVVQADMEPLDITLEEGIPIRGKVVYENGLPAVERSVIFVQHTMFESRDDTVPSRTTTTFSHFWSSTPTDENGEYTAYLLPGEYLIYRVNRTIVINETDTARQFDLTFSTPIFVELELADGSPVSEQIVSWFVPEFRDDTTRSHSESFTRGQFIFESSEKSGSLYFIDNHGKHGTIAKITPDMFGTTQRFTLQPMGSVTARLVDAENRPMAGQLMRLFYSHSDPASHWSPTYTETDSDGRVLLPVLSGKMPIMVAPPYSLSERLRTIHGTMRHFPVERDMDLAPGENVDLGTIKLVRVFGTFELERSNIQVNAMRGPDSPVREDRPMVTMLWIEDGAYDILLPPGHYRLSGMDYVLSIDEDSKDIRLDFDADGRGRIQGTEPG
ncbi:MAG: hypothetical protein FWG73_00490 [Planctomycetaceae bacterium]|nr:hypothetical protein [Planctomycetaceae bacterium]